MAAEGEVSGMSGMKMLRGKVAVVTGSTSGIGLGIAEALAAAGADILLNGLGADGANESLRAQLADRYHVRVALSGADVSRMSGVQTMIEQAARELGGTDVLVNNAGIQHTAAVADFPPERWDAVI